MRTGLRPRAHTSFPYAEWLPDEGTARGVEIDIDGRMIGIRYPMDAHLIGDSKETLRALLPLLKHKTTGPGGRRSSRTSESGGASWNAGPISGSTRSTRSSSPGSCRGGCPMLYEALPGRDER